MRSRLMQFVVVLMLLLAAIATVAAAQNSDDAEHVARLVEVLGIHAGAVVADIGAGDGPLTLLIAKEVGPTGRVYATELGDQSVKTLRAAIEKGSTTNVVVVEGHPSRTNLPRGCCDGIFIRYVYHHFADPPATNASLRDSLKPGGQIAIIEFAPEGSEATVPADRAGGKTHGVTAYTIARELRDAGFEVTASEQAAPAPGRGIGVFVAARKPD